MKTPQSQPSSTPLGGPSKTPLTLNYQTKIDNSQQRTHLYIVLAAFCLIVLFPVAMYAWFLLSFR